MYVSEQLPLPLEEKEEMVLFEQSLQGDIQAKSKLINHNLRLVVSISKKICEKEPFHLEDLVSVGTIGLIKGVQSNLEQPTTFRKHLSTSITNEIQKYISSRRK